MLSFLDIQQRKQGQIRNKQTKNQTKLFHYQTTQSFIREAEYEHYSDKCKCTAVNQETDYLYNIFQQI